jgi:acyl transferase domain-containing protein
VTAQYLWENIEKPVLFQGTVERVLEHFSRTDGSSSPPVFLEIGAHPVLSTNLKQSGAQDGHCLYLQKRDEQPLLAFFRSLGTLATRFAMQRRLSWANIFGDFPPSQIKFDHTNLPKYPFQRKIYRHLSEVHAEQVAPVAWGPMAGAQLFSGMTIFRQYMNLSTHPWLEGHRVAGDVVFPGAGYTEAMLEVIRSTTDGASDGRRQFVALSNLRILAPMTVPANEFLHIQVTMDKDTGEVTYWSKDEDEKNDGWSRKAFCTLQQSSAADEQALLDRAMQEVGEIRRDIEQDSNRAASKFLSREEAYERLNMLGLDYQGAFRLIAELEMDADRSAPLLSRKIIHMAR